MNKPFDTDERKLQVFLAFRQRLLGHAGRILRDRAEAEDVVQEAFMRWREQDAADLRTPEAWLTTVTTRIAIDRMRKNERQGILLPAMSDRDGRAGIADLAGLAGLAGPAWAGDGEADRESDPALTTELADGFRLLFGLLREDERKVLALREGFEFDFEEIAALTGKSVQNCRQIASRAKQRLGRQAGREHLPAADGRELARRCVDAFRAGDSHALMRLLSLQPAELVPPTKRGIEMHGAHAQASASAIVCRLLQQMLAQAACRIWLGLAVVAEPSPEQEAEAETIPLAA